MDAINPDPYELMNAYPATALAVAWVELFVCEPHGDSRRSAWDEMMDAPMNPREAVEILQATLAEEVAENQDAPASFRVALAEMGTPDFLRYVAGKMGAA